MGFLDWLKKKDVSQPETTPVSRVERMPYPAYRGKEPYIFVSYAHADSERVFKEIARLNEAGFHVWYDEGIAPGHTWTNEIADALTNCTVFIVMLTPISEPRENVQNEIGFALKKNKPFIAIHLEETILSGGMMLQIGMKQALLKYSMPDEQYMYKLTEALIRFGLKPKQVALLSPSRQNPEPPLQSEQTAKPANEPTPKPAGTELKPDAPVRIGQANTSPSPRDFEWIGTTLKKYHGSSSKVDIPDRAKKIMSRAFSEVSQMEYVRIPNSVIEIDFDAFYKCTDLKEAVIENPQVQINNAGDIGAFYGCSQVIVYCHKDSQTYEELKLTHTGEIRFI